MIEPRRREGGTIRAGEEEEAEVEGKGAEEERTEGRFSEPLFPRRATSCTPQRARREAEETDAPAHLLAVLLALAEAERALAAGACLRSNTDASADLVARLGTGPDDSADDLVADDGVVGGRGRPSVGEDVNVTVAGAGQRCTPSPSTNTAHLPQTPQQVILMSTSSSFHALGVSGERR